MMPPCSGCASCYRRTRPPGASPCGARRQPRDGQHVGRRFPPPPRVLVDAVDADHYELCARASLLEQDQLHARLQLEQTPPPGCATPPFAPDDIVVGFGGRNTAARRVSQPPRLLLGGGGETADARAAAGTSPVPAPIPRIQPLLSGGRGEAGFTSAPAPAAERVVITIDDSPDVSPARPPSCGARGPTQSARGHASGREAPLMGFGRGEPPARVRGQPEFGAGPGAQGFPARPATAPMTPASGSAPHGPGASPFNALRPAGQGHWAAGHQAPSLQVRVGCHVCACYHLLPICACCHLRASV
ncbi:hypothetical protein T492DRAFT_484699 [Pavlovales sp. CCMP2436]|nr:hypothetical protein T492DRAFT_484699 [Pavlovales sp. CCMP2436]